MTDPSADGLLHLLKAEPTLLPPAPAGDWGPAIAHRREDEVHTCLRCGKRTQAAFIAHTPAGPRWLDLCHACTYWLRTNMTEEPLYPPTP